MVDGRGWAALADATTRFIAEAGYYHFCENILTLTERRLYRESLFKVHKNKKEDQI